MASVTVDVRNLIIGLGKLNKGLSDMSPLFRNIAELELSETKLRFNDQKDPDGKNWPEPITIRRNSPSSGGGYSQQEAWNYVLKSNFHAVPNGYHWFSKSRGDKVLRDTGTLLASIGSASGKDYAVVGTNMEYANKLQKGRFPFIGINKLTVSNVNEAVDSYLKGLIK